MTATLELDMSGDLAQQYLKHFEDLWEPKNPWSVAPTLDDIRHAKAYISETSKK